MIADRNVGETIEACQHLESVKGSAIGTALGRTGVQR